VDALASRPSTRPARGHPELEHVTPLPRYSIDTYAVKIVQALGWFYPESAGGTEMYVDGLSRRLIGLGHEVLVAAPDPTRAEERHYSHHGLAVYRYPIPPAPTRAEARGGTVVRGAECFHRWLHASRPDVVHIHTFVTGLGLAEVHAAKQTGARVIVTTHAASLGFVCQRGTMMRWGERLCDGISTPTKCAACVLQHRGLPKAVAWTVAAIPPAVGEHFNRVPGRLGTALSMSAAIRRAQQQQQELLDTTDRFVVLTSWARNTVVSNAGHSEKVILNPLGYSLPLRRSKPAPNERATHAPIRIGCVGRFDRDKGLTELVRALRLLPGELSLTLELRGPARSDAERAFVAELQVLASGDPRITVGGEIPARDVLDVLASYDVLCCPSTVLEGGPTVAIEAQAAGTPVIGSNLGGLAELIEEGVNGRLVPPGDVHALAEVLREIVIDPAGTLDRWRAALPKSRTMDDVVRDYLAIYADSDRRCAA
jgi:glycosyltransferase involved in cell wall biosynthesis